MTVLPSQTWNAELEEHFSVPIKLTGEGTRNILSMHRTKNSSSSAEVVACCSVGSVDGNRDGLVDSDPSLVVNPLITKLSC